MATDMQKWIGRTARLEGQVQGLAGGPQLAKSSIEGGAIREYDEAGNLSQVIGAQHDGTHTTVSVAGPKPPTPWFPSASAVPGVVEVRWNGKFAGDTVSPMDFKHVAAYVVPVGTVVDLADQSGVMTGELGDSVQVQLDAGVYDVYLAAWSLSGKVSDLAGPVSVMVPEVVDGELLGGKVTVAEYAPTLADGEAKPENAMWNQIDPESKAQVAVWRWDGAAWVDMPITETMLPLVNIAEGTYGRLSGMQLDANAIDGMVITGAIVQSPGDGAGYQLTEGGYISHDANGNVTVRLPADGTEASFRGDLEARSLTATGRVSVQAAGNEIASGAGLTLEAGVTAPLTPPTVGSAYTSVAFPPPPEVGATVSGLAFANGLWWRCVRVPGPAYNRLEGLDAAGTIQSVRDDIDADPLNGITAIGNLVYMLVRAYGAPDNKRRVFAFDVSNLASIPFVRSWAYSAYGTGAYQPGIGTDGTNIMIGQCAADGELLLHRLNQTSGDAVDATISTGWSLKEDVAGLVQTSGDFGSARIVVAKRGGDTLSFSVSGVFQGNAESFYSSGKAPIVGLAWQSGAFYHLMQSGALVKYSANKNPSGDGADADDWWAAVSWAGAGSAETQAGPARRFQFMRRSELQVNAGALPAGATGVKVYLARRNAPPSRTDMHWVWSSDGATARVVNLPANWGTQASPAATNTFSAATPGLIKSRADNFVVRGDGTGKWGPLVFNADGSMTSTATPAWVPITSFDTGFGPQSWGFVPAYRAWPDGKVELRGVIAGPLTVAAVIATLPTLAKPAQPVNLVAATSAASGQPATMRVEFGSNANPTKITVYPQSVNRTWVALDGLYYYVS